MSVYVISASDILNVVPWIDPIVDRLGHDPRSHYVETFWLGVLGPSTTWLLRRTAAEFDTAPDGFVLDLSDVARSLGLGGDNGPSSAFHRTLTRCQIFGMARTAGTGAFAVRRMLPPLARRHLVRLPEALQQRHRQWEEDRTNPTLDRARRRARLLALDFAEAGNTAGAIEGELLRRGCHPSLTQESVRWAIATRRQPD